MTAEVAVRNDRAVSTFDPAEGVLRVPTQVSGVYLTFTPDQKVLNDAQMVLLAPLGIEAGWDPRQVAVFLMECQERGMDPWQREAYLMLYPGGKYIRHVGIDGFRARGESTGEYRGRTTPLFCDEDERWREIWPFRDRPPFAAKVGILRAGFDAPVYAVAHYDEYVPMQDEKVWKPVPGGGNEKVRTGKRRPGENWRTAAEGGKPTVMISKCSEAQAWRAAFPRRFGGFYAPEEMERVRAEAKVEDTTAAKRRAAFEAEQITVSEAPKAEPLTDADHGLLLAELDEQAEVLGKTVADLCSRWSASRDGRAIGTATATELADHVHRIRPYVLEVLREQGRDDEAASYERAPAVAAVHELFGRGPAIPEPPEGVVESA